MSLITYLAGFYKSNLQFTLILFNMNKHLLYLACGVISFMFCQSSCSTDTPSPNEESTITNSNTGTDDTDNGSGFHDRYHDFPGFSLFNAKDREQTFSSEGGIREVKAKVNGVAIFWYITSHPLYPAPEIRSDIYFWDPKDCYDEKQFLASDYVHDDDLINPPYEFEIKEGANSEHQKVPTKLEFSFKWLHVLSLPEGQITITAQPNDTGLERRIILMAHPTDGYDINNYIEIIQAP